jgi:hypothetical protein
MNEQIKAHLDYLLMGAPKTRRVEEMRQELLAGCLDKYADLTAQGVAPEEAYNKVIEGIGDVSELLEHLERANAFDPAAAEEKRKKKALFTALGVGLFIFGVVLEVIAEALQMDGIGGVFILLCAAAGVIMLIYGNMAYSVKYEKTDDTLVEDIKVQMTKGKTTADKKTKSMVSLASGSLWCLLVLVYFLLGFFGSWDTSWILFVFGGALQCLIVAYFYPDRRAGALSGVYCWCVVTAYFLLSFLTRAWSLTWLIFIAAVCGELGFKFFRTWRDEK